MCEITGELGWRPSMEVNHFLIHFRVCTEGDLGWRPDSLLQLQLPLLTNFAWCWIPQVTKLVVPWIGAPDGLLRLLGIHEQ